MYVERRELDLPDPIDPELDYHAETPVVHFAWLEITGKCQLQCVHCYAESGPDEAHGDMSTEQWKNSIDQVRALGGKMVQFIGGEPLLHPALPELVDHARGTAMEVEIYSNLSYVSDSMWKTLSRPGVRVATSYYSPAPAEHEAITKNRGSHARTRSNIIEAIQRGIPLRAGIIGVHEDQQVSAAHEELVKLGVEDIRVDHLRQVGRGVRNLEPSTEQLCGNCGDGVVAILGNGAVQPCVFSRWGEFTVGNIQEQPLIEILSSDKAQKVQAELDEAFGGSSPQACRPNCSPNCKPSAGDPCSPECSPKGLSQSLSFMVDPIHA